MPEIKVKENKLPPYDHGKKSHPRHSVAAEKICICCFDIAASPLLVMVHCTECCSTRDNAMITLEEAAQNQLVCYWDAIAYIAKQMNFAVASRRGLQKAKEIKSEKVLLLRDTPTHLFKVENFQEKKMKKGETQSRTHPPTPLKTFFCKKKK